MTYFCKSFLLIGLFSLIMACGANKDNGEKTEATPEAYVEQAAFTSLDGDSVHISDYVGKVVMIDFWETWCKPCIASFSALQKLQNEYPDDFIVLAVTPGFTDTRKDAETFMGNHDYSFEFLMDSNGLHQKLGVQSIPYKVFVDANGNFISASMGSYGSEQDYKKIKEIIEQHSDSTGAATAGVQTSPK